METIGVCGYGFTGSGAVYDYLKEYEQCTASIDYEFIFPYIQHGLQDLEYHLSNPTRFFSSDAAIKDFKRLVDMYDNPCGGYRRICGNEFRDISYRFLESITLLSWKGKTIEDEYLASEPYRTFRYRVVERLIHIIETRNRKCLPKPRGEKVYLGATQDEFVGKARQYVRQLLEAFNYDFNKKVLLNQPYDVNNPARSMKYFENPKAIIVDRDPRDIYVLAKKYLNSEGDFICTDAAESYIQYHRIIRRSNCYKGGQNVLLVRYEDLIYDYNAISMKIAEFLGLDPTQRRVNKYFDPTVSLENTQLFQRHPELKMDIQLIESELSEYLYPFEQFHLKPSHAVVPF